MSQTFSTTKASLHKRVSSRQKRKIVEAALERQGQLALLITACLAQAGGEILLKKSTMNQCVAQSATWGFEIRDKNETECMLTLLTGEINDSIAVSGTSNIGYVDALPDAGSSADVRPPGERAPGDGHQLPPV